MEQGGHSRGGACTVVRTPVEVGGGDGALQDRFTTKGDIKYSEVVVLPLS